MADAGTITLKVVFDTTEFDAARERVKAALAELAEMQIKISVVTDRPQKVWTRK